MHTLTITRASPRSAATLYRAWTTGWASWFAEGDTAQIRAEVGAPFFFEVAQRFTDGREPVRHPHYGRFLRLVPDALVSLTWVTGAGGTGGAETTVTVHLDAIAGDYTQVTLTHAGFTTAEARDAHDAAWPMILAHQDSALADVAPASAAAPLRNRSIPDTTFIPVRSYPDLEAAVAWLRDVLGARERLRIPGHRVQLSVGDGAMVVAAWDAAAVPATGGRPPAVLMVRVPDVHAAYARAIALGATGLTPPADHPYGERQASVRDPAGHAWMLTQTIADVDPASWGGELVE
ncbi:SRPBCC domain-containing protein [Gemmatimonas sp.]|uniref:SRPBCC domain-containing protein n=1 Tax=Gemmatimonas sp. TaxID=1962908 RepID=UPI00286E23D8|nr:SRPBCC domain-containing protein [Gemmatimonas sp.]